MILCAIGVWSKNWSRRRNWLERKLIKRIKSIDENLLRQHHHQAWFFWSAQNYSAEQYGIDIGTNLLTLFHYNLNKELIIHFVRLAHSMRNVKRKYTIYSSEANSNRLVEAVFHAINSMHLNEFAKSHFLWTFAKSVEKWRNIIQNKRFIIL